MATQQELIVKIRGDIEDIQQKLSAVQKSVGKTQSAFSKIGGGIAKVGKGIAIAGAAVSGAAALIGKKSLDAAANVEEMENKFNVVFSNTSSAMDEWADNFANAIGRNNTEIKTAISNQADLLIGMGMSEEAAGDLAKQYTTLAYDLASFNNVNDEQAVEAMTKALMGETEMMKALGVNISDTVMEQSEFVKASGKAWKAMTMEEKAQMRLLEAQKQSVNALGDAERSAASYTNQMKRLQSNIQKVHEVIGKYLLPVFTPLITKMGCPNNKEFFFLRTEPVKGNQYGRTVELHQCEDCSGCPHRSKCHKSKFDRIIRLNYELTSFHKEVLDNLNSIHGALLRMNRSIQSEGTYGEIKSNRGYERFRRRGINKAILEIALISCGFNLHKYHLSRLAKAKPVKAAG